MSEIFAKTLNLFIPLLLGTTLLIGCNQNTPIADIDVLINNAIIIDGSGQKRFVGDIAINNDKIFMMNAEIDANRAKRRIDATGLVAAPGFIDPHTHLTDIKDAPKDIDGKVFDKALAENFLRQGVTTVANTLHSVDQPYPLGPFLDSLEAAPNTVWTSGHSWTRKHVMGLDNRAPTLQEMDAMKEVVKEAMDAGAIGLGTGLEYVPAAYAEFEEIAALAKYAAQFGNGNAIYVTHLRDEGARLKEALDESIAIGTVTGLPVHISHIKNTGSENWTHTPAVLNQLEEANAAGSVVTYDVYPYTAFSTYSDIILPAWTLAGGTEEFKKRVNDPTTRARILTEMKTIFSSQTAGTLDSVQFRDVKGFEGKTLRDYLVANEMPETLDAGFEAVLDLHSAGRFTAIFQAMKPEDVVTFLQHPLACVSSDGSLVAPGVGYPHPRSYGSYGRVLGKYVRELGVLTLEEAVQKMSTCPASVLGIENRGRLSEGFYADIVLFNPDTIADKAKFTDPHNYTVGVTHLIVNGELVLENGNLTGAKPGKVIRRKDWRPQ